MTNVEFIEKVEKTLFKKCGYENNDNKKNGIVIGFSGGPDSVALLAALTQIIKADNIVAVHVNHMIRGEQADNDEKFCANLAKKISVKFYSEKVDIPSLSRKNKMSTEQCARDVRYEIFDRIASKYGYSNIAVAHNINDQAETVLLNIGRGSGLKGLCGMEYRRGNIIRPLLDCSRSEIEAFAHEYNPVIDASNLEREYTRNKIRLDVIPLLNEVFERDIISTLNDLSRNASIDNDYLESVAELKLRDNITQVNDGCISIPSSLIISEHRAVSTRIIRNAIQIFSGTLNNIALSHIDKVIQICENGESSKKVHLPNSITVEYKYNKIFFSEMKFEKKFEQCEQVFSIDINSVFSLIPEAGVDVKVGNYLVRFELTNGAEIAGKPDISASEMFFNINALKNIGNSKHVNTIDIRFKKPGDRIRPYKGSGSKKLKEYFIDRKIDSCYRGQIPLLAIDNEIIWAVGYTVNDLYLGNKNDETVLKLIVTRDI